MSRDAASFDPELFAFLRELAEHNDRPWFTANKTRYEEHVKEPALAFIEDVGYRLPAVAPHLTADRRSLFRIYRDTRFSRDKTPYKTHVGIFFRHAQAADAETPGLYVNLAPRDVFLGAGIWHPSSAALKRIRTAIVNRPAGWTKAVAAVAPEWELADGEKLVRAPAGFPADHELVDDLRRKSFAVIARLGQGDATGPRFLDEVERLTGSARPFLAFLCEALGVEY